jgi:hypothetical protein
MSDQLPGAPHWLRFTDGPLEPHFRVRTDLIEELCVADAFTRTLPNTPEAHARWIAMWGYSARECPFESIQRYLGRPYEPSLRFLLQPAVLPGREHVQNVVTDARGWSVCCELGGLYDFVMKRAVQFLVSGGFETGREQAEFYPKPGPNLGPKPRYGRLVMGYECATGGCTIFSRDGSEVP